MPELHIYADAEQAFNLDSDKLLAEGELTGIGMLRHGTSEGRATVSMVVTLADGSQISVQTTWRLFRTAALALMASPIAAEESEA